MNYKCIFPYLKVNLDHGTLPWRPWGSPIGEAPRIPTNIPPEPKNMEESTNTNQKTKKKCGFRNQSSASKVLIIIAIFFMQLLANGCLLFVDFDRMCTLLGDLLRKSLLFKVMTPAVNFAAEMTGVPKTWSERLDMNTCESWISPDFPPLTVSLMGIEGSPQMSPCLPGK